MAQSEIIETYPAGRLMHHGDEQGGQVSLIDHRGVLGFHLSYCVACIAGLGRCAAQITSWRSLYAGVNGLATRVLDGFLLVRFDTIVSAAQRTRDTERFWRIQLSGAAMTRTIGRIVGDAIQVCPRGADVQGWFATAPTANHCLFISKLTLSQEPVTMDDADILAPVELADLTGQQQEMVAAGQIVAEAFPQGMSRQELSA